MEIKISKVTIGLTILVAVLLGVLVTRNSQVQSFGGTVGSPTAISGATTTTSQAITSSARILATTTNPTDASGSYQRVYATICNPNANPVFINLDNDRPANVSNATVVLAAAAGYNACWTLNDVSYQGSIQASSTNQTSTTINFQQYVR